MATDSFADREPILLTEIADQKTYQDLKVLVVNSSDRLAREITVQLGRTLPGCAIIYSPTIALARLILQRRKINLVVSCPDLPDGSIIDLSSILEGTTNPPDLLLVGDAEEIEDQVGASYQVKAKQLLESTETLPSIHRPSNRQQREQELKEVSADLRNDLNNPLQTIVAMLYVAQNGSAVSESSARALAAIEDAAHNMADVVRKMEGRLVEKLG